MITGEQDSTPAELRAALAVEGVLPKPFRMAELQVLVVQVLQRAHGSSPAPRAP